jgi:hypothetical protein
MRQLKPEQTGGYAAAGVGEFDLSGMVAVDIEGLEVLTREMLPQVTSW